MLGHFPKKALDAASQITSHFNEPEASLGLAVGHFTTWRTIREQMGDVFPLGSSLRPCLEVFQPNFNKLKQKYKAILFFSAARVSFYKHGPSCS